MPETRLVTRTVFVLNRGVRLCWLIAVLLLVLAGWRLVAPIEIQSSEGPMFSCGSAIHPPAGDFQRNVCGRLAEGRQLETGFAAGAGLVLAIGGLLTFGLTRRTEEVAVDEPVDEPAEKPAEEPADAAAE
jgi:hypothetical protein